MSVRALAIIVLLSLLFSGCGMDGDRLEQKATQKLEKLKGYYAEVDAVVFSLEGEQHYQVKQWFLAPSRWRVEVTTAAGEQVFICDGSQIYVYQPGFNDFYRVDVNTEKKLAAPFLLSGYLEQFIATKTLNFQGERNEDGQTYYLISYEHSASFVEKVQLWLDKKTFFPMKIETYIDDELISRIICSRLELTTKFDESLFKFESPGTGEVASYCLIRPLSLDEAGENWLHPVYVPEYVPSGCFLFVVSRGEENGKKQLILTYKGDHHFSLVQRSKGGPPYQAEATRKVLIGSTTAYYHKNQTDDLATLWWSQQETDFILTGTLPLEEMVRIAFSIKEKDA